MTCTDVTSSHGRLLHIPPLVLLVIAAVAMHQPTCLQSECLPAAAASIPVGAFVTS